jgi:hypothetical protein
MRGRGTCGAGGRIKPGAQAPGSPRRIKYEPAERATADALSPAPRAELFTLIFSWGLRPRLYSFVRFADSFGSVS